jgi:xanthine dehydrogenase YagS FAD-binding subunit
MNPITYLAGTSVADATRAVGAAPEGAFLAGGTTLVDLMKLDVLTPAVLVGLDRLPLDTIEMRTDGLHVGAMVTNSELAWHPDIREYYPALSEAILSGASTQLRNMATTAGNIMQRTRCGYFRDINAACNRREPGTGCDAIDGLHRGHAVLGTSDRCIAVHASDMCVALVMFDAIVHTQKVDGTKGVYGLNDFHLVPGDTPERETVLEHGELITHVVLPPLLWSWRSHYLKVRDRASYEFALTSASVALQMNGDQIALARLALGGVGTKPWRAWDAESQLHGQAATPATFAAAAETALARALPRRDNAFKIELAKRTIVRAFTELLARPEGASP